MDIELPKLADTLVEGTVSRWLKRPGEQVRKGEPLVEIETDKVNTELESPADGILIEILVAEGETVEVGRVIGRLSDTTGIHSATRQPAAAATQAPQGPEAGLSTMRRRIAERMQEARARIPQGACVREVDLSRLERGGRSWTAFFVKALAAASGIANIGVAVEVPDGLLVPVVKGAGDLSVEDIAAAVADLAARGRSGELHAEDMTGGGFTVTNLGSVGTLMAFPLLNPGQPGILAAGAVRDGRCLLTLCYDRREMDDYSADRLLSRIAGELETLS